MQRIREEEGDGIWNKDSCIHNSIPSQIHVLRNSITYVDIGVWLCEYVRVNMRLGVSLCVCECRT